jgi:hypothetical protein
MIKVQFDKERTKTRTDRAGTGTFLGPSYLGGERPTGLLLLLGMLAAAPVPADESAIKLKDGDGRALVEANCVMCHSLDYIPMNSVFLDRKGWDASVNKMIKVMGAPIPEQDVPALVDYLTRNYGKP